jgi:hypothetical protein
VSLPSPVSVPLSLSSRGGPRTVREVLESWCAAGLTGALRVLDPSGGAVYVIDGRICYAECPQACGVDRLLTASGRLPAEVWRGAVAAGRAGRRVGEVLLEQGHLTRAELELFVATALMDAAWQLFGSTAEARFEAGAGPAVGPVYTVDLPTVAAEVDRRHRALAAAWPSDAADAAAVLPSRRIQGQYVALTALQWEIVANADRRRTPADLARLLGRDTFSTLLEVRRMVRAGLVEPGRPRARGVATVDPGTEPATEPEPAAEPMSGPTADRTSDGRPGSVPHDDDDHLRSTVDTPADAPLPRRLEVPDRPDPARWVPPEQRAPEPCPEGVLLRIRRALEAL